MVLIWRLHRPPKLVTTSWTWARHVGDRRPQASDGVTHQPRDTKVQFREQHILSPGPVQLCKWLGTSSLGAAGLGPCHICSTGSPRDRKVKVVVILQQRDCKRSTVWRYGSGYFVSVGRWQQGGETVAVFQISLMPCRWIPIRSEGQGRKYKKGTSTLKGRPRGHFTNDVLSGLNRPRSRVLHEACQFVVFPVRMPSIAPLQKLTRVFQPTVQNPNTLHLLS